MIIEPYADHVGHRKNLSGQHKGNLFCVECAVRVAEREQDEEQASASVPVVAVVTGAGIDQVALSARLIAYGVAARSKGQMQLTRNFRATIKGFNADFGTSCRTWDEVAVKVNELKAARR